MHVCKACTSPHVGFTFYFSENIQCHLGDVLKVSRDTLFHSSPVTWGVVASSRQRTFLTHLAFFSVQKPTHTQVGG